MKKYALHCIECTLVMVLTLTSVPQLIQAQEPAPTNWDNFINSADNPIVSDTFRMQTFAGKETDNWKYMLSGGAEVTDRPTLKLPLGSKVTFEPFTLDKYTGDSIMGVSVAFSKIIPKEKLTFEVFRQNTLQALTVIAPIKNDSSSGYQTKLITKRPTSLSIEASLPASNSLNGYFATDRVFAFGNIPEYSLFTGPGNWNDTIRWSHLPPFRHRKALINGKIAISANTLCKHIALNNGNIHLSTATKLTIDNLILYNENSTLYSEGEIIINNQLIIQKTFAEKGKWYFISFPFDVYADNIASPFVQKDDVPNNGGNFFYVQTYNGDKRATSNKASGNWEVLPIRSGNTPVFEKNKGYLVALDEKATTLTLSFSSKPGDIPSDFAKNGSISIPAPSSNAGTRKENLGWYLCGNPFPAPLKLSELENTSTLDGYIYIFQNGSYKAYPIDSDYAIPPYSAFFVKSSGQAEIKISYRQPLKSVEMAEPSVFSYSLQSEPDTKDKATHIAPSAYTKTRYYINNNILSLENIPEAGHLYLFSLTGSCLLNYSLQKGNSAIPIPLKPGVYLIKFQIAHMQETRKVILL